MLFYLSALASGIFDTLVLMNVNAEGNLEKLAEKFGFNLVNLD